MAGNSEVETHIEALKSEKLTNSDTFEFPKPGNLRISGDMADNLLWIEFKFKKIKSLRASALKEGGFRIEEKGPRLKFIAPTEFQETMTHSWEDASNVGQRALQAYRGVKATLSDASSLVNSIKQAGEDIKNRVLPGDNTGNAKSKEAEDKSKEAISKSETQLKTGLKDYADAYEKKSFYKFDVPQMYKDTPKPSYHFQFSLADTGNPEYDIMLPIQMLKYLSSPNKPTNKNNEPDLVQYEFPYICEVNTVYGDTVVPLINVEYAAITSLQTDFTGPYRNGMPSKAEITLTISNLMPIYKSTLGSINNDSISNVITISSKDDGTTTKLTEGQSTISDSFDIRDIENFYGRSNAPDPVGKPQEDFVPVIKRRG